MKIDVKNIRPLYQTKKEPKVTDPPRYPKVITPIENEAKAIFAKSTQELMKDLAKKMVEMTK